MDAPPMHGRPAIGKPVLGSVARFNAGFPAMLAEKDKEYVLYAMNLHCRRFSSGRNWNSQGPFQLRKRGGISR